MSPFPCRRGPNSNIFVCLAQSFSEPAAVAKEFDRRARNIPAYMVSTLRVMQYINIVGVISAPTHVAKHTE